MTVPLETVSAGAQGETTAVARPGRIPRFAQRIFDLAESDPQLQNLAPDVSVITEITAPDRTLEQIVTTVLESYPGRPALGARAYEVIPDPETGRSVRRLLPRFDTISYGELRDRVRALATVWRTHDHHRVAEGDFVCTLGFAGIDYTVVDLACVLAHAVAVPLQTTLAGSDLEDIFAKTCPTAVAAPAEDLVRAAELAARQHTVLGILAMDLDTRMDDHRDALAAAEAILADAGAPARIVDVSELVESGRGRPWEPLPKPADVDERLVLIVHSSGSTGTPKGAIINDRYARIQFTAVPRVLVPIVRLCFAPMNHFMGRGALFNTLARGGTAYFTAEPDMSTLLDDFRLSRPTESAVFPRVFEIVHQQFINEVARRSAESDLSPEALRAEVMVDMRTTALGDRISMLYGGSAPLAPELERFVTDCFPVTYAEGYGTTEAGGAVTIRNRVNRPDVIDYKLRDVPELGYYTTDRPYPRGELCVKTQLGIPGYFKNPEATAALFDELGYIRTGDIMEERGPDHIVYVDRRNDVLKLAQGEFVTLGALTNAFETRSELIRQIFLYGNSTRGYLLAVVVPERIEVERVLGAGATDAQVKDLVRGELKRVHDEQGLRTFDVPRDFVLEWEPFSHENGLLSSVQKRLRPALRTRYGPVLEDLYVELERRQQDELLALRDPDSDLTVSERVVGALAAVLGLEGIDTGKDYSFGELGGDSLSAVSFSALLTSMFGVDVPVNAILSPAGNVGRWSRMIESALSMTGEARPTFASIHGAGTRELRAADLDIDRLLPASVRESPATGGIATDPRTVLVTGATGYLGRFLCLSWLERVARTGGKVVSLVRASDPDAARARLAATFGTDPALAQRFSELAAEHLEVVVGDVTDQRLGLDADTYDRLAREVDRIVHPAALVNHVFGYEELFGPNVAGTAELVALALTHRQKVYDFVSSLAVLPLLERSGRADEDSPLRETIALRAGYTAGYGASKWAAEVLLHSANRRYALPVNVFRGDMILPHRRYHAQVNAPDVFVRLLTSIVATGLAPQSFYELGTDGNRRRAHYDGLPVDFIAEALIDTTAESHRVVRTFHVVNPHDDGVSLDTFVDWIEAAGYPVTRVAPYEEWLRRFEDKLRALPDERRQQSSLSVIESLQHPGRADEPVPGSARFAAAVARQPREPAIPHLDRPYLMKCLDDLRRLGLIDAPIVEPVLPAGAPA